ncbi:ABC transporter ATP-binding protein [Anoxynatronum buryatiense]|uniref:Nickel transport system ATP-binding protein n=1 Tax=Anoxynatronum buryatiense TaxID=489973 RepID=A0AA45WWY6_9CLOT|nr:ABC transporter ATP-binding protein [Anoxynatronum buryatiense]SMP61590.1 nickel transport system ATP-binding protein [Anoxynatronum buryatiense]
MAETILQVEDLSVSFEKNGQRDMLVQNVSFQIEKNQCLGIVGESGSGKSITCKAILGLLRPPFHVTGKVSFLGRDLLLAEDTTLRKVRGSEIAMILQHPMTAFDPLEPIGKQMTESITLHKGISEKEALILSAASLEKLNIHQPMEVIQKYPHQVSGGMLQRVMIAIALVMEPAVIIADEPTTAVDAVNVATVVELFESLKKMRKTALVFVSHDLNVVARLSDQLVVMNEGSIVERGQVEEVLHHPQHPKAQQLVETRQALVNQFYRYVKRR